MAILLFFIIFCILFYIKGYGEIIKNIEEIIKSKKRNENENIEVKKKFENNGQNFNVGKIRTIKNRSKTNRINIITSNLSSSDIIELQKININKSSSFEKNNQNIFNDNNEIHLNEENIQFNKDNNYVDFEINSLTYEEAIKIDKRTFIQYYISLVKTKHLLVFSFFNRKDYNSNIIKKCLFFYSFALFYFVNALFFTDATMHKIYVDGGLFNFAYAIPQIIYSSIISSVINSLIRIISLSEKEIIKIKKDENYKKMLKDIPKIKKCLKIRFASFFIVCFIF